VSATNLEFEMLMGSGSYAADFEVRVSGIGNGEFEIEMGNC
jgi:hypothetical protein